ncbi:hypothetical protein BCU71_10015 [Vibrio lentus]|uniref:hypothetical protein n=1 Tax=Vibrio lentus TaxID=136468 RepID=UPI000C851D6B|nr:hypothetical protein [Vibrio lentus]PMH23771.1 hypothetical protein BCU71_10015 [Vibrio lentus]PMK62978.1 hypothetical protein BCT93_14985 [Vibrio lentus]
MFESIVNSNFTEVVIPIVTLAIAYFAYRRTGKVREGNLKFDHKIDELKLTIIMHNSGGKTVGVKGVRYYSDKIRSDKKLTLEKVISIDSDGNGEFSIDLDKVDYLIYDADKLVFETLKKEFVCELPKKIVEIVNQEYMRKNDEKIKTGYVMQNELLKDFKNNFSQDN